MADGSRFTKIVSIEHEINYSEDEIVGDVFTETEGSLKMYITSGQQWMSTDHGNLSNRAVFLGKIQSPATEVFSTTLEFVDLIDLANIQFTELQSIVEEVICDFNVNSKESCHILKDITSIVNNAAKDIERQKPKDFEIEIFIDIVVKDICSTREFREKYGELFKGTTSALFMRTKRFLEEGDSECCDICTVEFMPGVDEVVVMPCSDVFHKICVGHWLNERSNICPVCYWSATTAELAKSYSGLPQAKQMFDKIQDIVNNEKTVCDPCQPFDL